MTQRVPQLGPGWPHAVERAMDGARRCAQALWVRVLYCSGALWWAKRELSRQGAIIVLTFHRVLEDHRFSETNSLSNIVVRESTFRRLAQYVADRYDVVDIRHARAAHHGRLRLAFTFDDGWKDNYENAWPVLKAKGIPATVFLCTGLLGQNTPFWPEELRGRLFEPVCRRYGKRGARLIEALIESLKYGSSAARESHTDLLLRQNAGTQPALFDQDGTLGWEQIRQMRQAGIAFGSHTHTHQILTSVSLDAVRAEIGDSKAALESALQEVCVAFAYPNGNWSPEIRDIVAQSGYRFAFTTDRQAWLPGTDPLAIPRSNVQEEDLIGLSGRFSAAMFDYATFWKIWRCRRSTQTQRTDAAVPVRAAVQELP